MSFKMTILFIQQSVQNTRNYTHELRQTKIFQGWVQNNLIKSLIKISLVSPANFSLPILMPLDKALNDLF